MAFTVSYKEIYGYPRSGWQDGEFDAERRVLVAWSDRGTFLSELDAYPNCQYPYTDDGPANALVRRVRVHPFGKMVGTGSTANYDWSIIQIWLTVTVFGEGDVGIQREKRRSRGFEASCRGIDVC